MPTLIVENQEVALPPTEVPAGGSGLPPITRGNYTREKLDKCIDSMRHLPPSPGVMIRLLELFKQPDCDIDQVVELLRHDPSIAAELLKRCNSAVLKGVRPVTDVLEGVSRIGFYESYRLIVGVFGSRFMAPKLVAGAFNVEALWRHSVATAVAADLLARQLGEVEPEAYTAGLFHDVGKAVLAELDGAAYARFVLVDQISGLKLVKVEQALFGFDHAEVGARLLARWNMPPAIVMAVRHHHELSGTRAFERLTFIVRLADQLTPWIEKEVEVPAEVLAGHSQAIQVLGLLPEQIVATVRDAQADYAGFGELMGNPLSF
jgi:putative nucleotidyltransferase with HDIG domain